MKKILFLILLDILLIGCATSADLRKLSIGMDKKEVVKVLGEPISTRASTRTYGKVEIWDYNLFKNALGFPPGSDTTYWLFFKENKLYQWGEEDDWGILEKDEREPDYIEKRIFEEQTEPRFQ